MKITFPIEAVANSPLVLYNVRTAIQKLPGLKLIEDTILPGSSVKLELQFTKNKRKVEAEVVLTRGSTTTDVHTKSAQYRVNGGEWSWDRRKAPFGRLDEVLRVVYDSMTARAGVGL